MTDNIFARSSVKASCFLIVLLLPFLCFLDKSLAMNTWFPEFDIYRFDIVPLGSAAFIVYFLIQIAIDKKHRSIQVVDWCVYGFMSFVSAGMIFLMLLLKNSP